MNLSVVIPAYNEENRLEKTLGKIRDYLSSAGYSFEIIVIDDGSKDKTALIIEKFNNIILLKNEKNYGKGYSVKRGMLKALFDYVLFTDADLSTPIEEVEKLLYHLKNNTDIAIGSRALKESKIVSHQKKVREGAGKLFNVLVRCLLLPGIYDTQCGFKCFKKEVAKDIFSKTKIGGFSFDVEALYIAKKLGYNIKEVPVVWENSLPSRVNILKHPLQMILELVIIKYRGGNI